MWPRPYQTPHPPIHIPGGGSVETYDFCLDNTYSYSYLSFSGYLRAKALMQGYWDRVAERAPRLAAELFDHRLELRGIGARLIPGVVSPSRGAPPRRSAGRPAG